MMTVECNAGQRGYIKGSLERGAGLIGSLKLTSSLRGVMPARLATGSGNRATRCSQGSCTALDRLVL